MIGLETWPGKDGWMKRKPLGLRITTSERVYSKERLDTIISNHITTSHENSIAKGLPIDILHDFKCHYKGQYRIRYRGPSDFHYRYRRPASHTIQEFAKTFAIYER